MVSTAPELPNQEEALKAIPRDEWTRQNEDMFCCIVDERKRLQTGKRGAVAATCTEFGVDPTHYQYWRTRLVKEIGNKNGEKPGNGKPADVPAAPADDVSPETFVADKSVAAEEPTPKETIAYDQAVVRSGIERLMEEADQLAMRLETDKHPLAEALGYQILSVRMILAQLHKDGVTLEKPVKPTAAADLAREFSNLLSDTHVEPDVPAEETIPETTAAEPVAEPLTAEVIPQPTPPVTVKATEHAEAQPAPPEKTHEKQPPSKKDLVALCMQAALGVAVTKYERMVELTVKECVRRFKEANPHAKWTDEQAYERFASDAFVQYDPATDGHPLHFVERRFLLKQHAREFNGNQMKELGLAYNPRGFDMARQRSRRDDLPPGITYELLKTEAYRTLGLLAGMHDPNEFGDFWTWAEPQVAKVLDAACGDKAASFFDIRGKAKQLDRQKTVAERLVDSAMGEQARIRAKPADEPRHRAMIQYIKGLANDTEERTIEDIMRTIVNTYLAEISVTASQMHDERMLETIDDCMTLLLRSTLKSVWMFDPRRGGNLDEYIRTGWRLEMAKI